jgi:hypothetical protein
MSLAVGASPDVLLAYAKACSAMDDELLVLGSRLAEVDAALGGDVVAFARRGLEHDRWVEAVAGRFVVAMATRLEPMFEHSSPAEHAALVASLIPLVSALRERWPRAVMTSSSCSSRSSAALAPRDVARAIDVLEGRVPPKKQGGIADGLVSGLVLGSFDEVGFADTGAELARIAGAFASGLPVYGDLRDGTAEIKRGNWPGAFWNLVGAVPIVGDIGKGIQAGAEGFDALHDASKASESIKDAARLLEESEEASGHTFAKHVKDIAYLLDRMSRATKKPFVSTFANKPDAARATSEIIARRNGDIEDWLRGPSQKTLPLSEFLGWNTGVALKRGTLEVIPVQSARLVLIKDNSPRGFHVLSAFPQP